MTKKMGVILSSVLIVCLFTGTAYLCGPDFTFRAYLNKHFWQPFAKYEDFRIRMEPGDTLVLYSDGVTEAANPASHLSTNNVLATCQKCHPSATAKSLRFKSSVGSK